MLRVYLAILMSTSFLLYRAQRPIFTHCQETVLCCCWALCPPVHEFGRRIRADCQNWRHPKFKCQVPETHISHIILHTKRYWRTKIQELLQFFQKKGLESPKKTAWNLESKCKKLNPIDRWKTRYVPKKTQYNCPPVVTLILLMEQILHQLIWRISHDLQGFCTIQTVVAWDFWTINSIKLRGASAPLRHQRTHCKQNTTQL